MIKENEIVKELKKLISFKPITSSKVSTTALLRYVEAELTKAGLLTELSKSEGFPSLVAGTKSLQSSHVLLQAHIDVVPAEKNQFEINQIKGVLEARGAYDMLFATACYIVLMRKFRKSGQLSKLDVGIMLTGDEEIGGYNGVARLIRDYSCKVCFLPDAGAPTKINVRARGVLQLEIILQGKGGHVGKPDEYDNPIILASKLISKISERFSNKNVDDTVCSISMIKAGEALNQVPSTAKVTLDIRFAQKDKPKHLLSEVTAIATSCQGRVRVICNDSGYSINPKQEYIKKFLELYQKRTGLKVGTTYASGSSDARFIAQQDIPVIMMRPEGGGMHSANETINIKSLNIFANVLSEYIELICKS